MMSWSPCWAVQDVAATVDRITQDGGAGDDTLRGGNGDDTIWGNTRRLHASLGYVTPDDEHQGRGDTIRQARQDDLKQARLTRIAYHRNNNRNQP